MKNIFPGERFGLLTTLELLSDSGKRGFGRKRWRCFCSCGKEVTVLGYNLKNGNSTSCGCTRFAHLKRISKLPSEKRRLANIENGRRTGPINGKIYGCKNLIPGSGRKDGLAHHPLAGVFHQMRSRCYNPKHRSFAEYGGNGVAVAEPWRERAKFIFGILALLGPCPEGYSLDRINPHGDYVEWNVRWASPATQSVNRRDKVLDFYCQSGEH